MLDELARVWVEELIGPFEVASEFSHSHGYSSLWRLKTAERYLWLKLHRYPGKWAGEVHALLNWAVPGVASPEVEGYRSEPCSLLMSEVPGIPAGKIDLERKAEVRLWEEAGAYLAKLHQRSGPSLGGVSVDGVLQGDTHTDAASFVRQNIENRIRQGDERGLWSTDERSFIVEIAPVWTESLAGEGAVAVHRDFGPRNWFTDARGALTAVIDWEHSRWDVRAADLNRPWDDTFVAKPYLAEAFEEGYGGFDARLKSQIQALRLHGAVAGIVWATDVEDWVYRDLNRAALARLRATR